MPRTFLGFAALALMFGAHAALADTAKPAYLVAEVEVTDQATFQAYGAKVPDTLKPFNGHLLARGKPVLKEGNISGVIVIIGFDSMADAEKWWNSPAYQAIIPERQKSSTAKVVFVEGLPPS
jgi:uncharacterized protein (DUF1330 family)